MKEILYNMALLDCSQYAKEQGIDISGSHLVKYPRRFTYALVRDATGRAIITTTFYKNRTPSRVIHN